MSTFTPKAGMFSVVKGAPIFEGPSLTSKKLGEFPVVNDHVQVLGGVLGWRVCIVDIGTETIAAWVPADQGTDVPPVLTNTEVELKIGGSIVYTGKVA